MMFNDSLDVIPKIFVVLMKLTYIVFPKFLYLGVTFRLTGALLKIDNLYVLYLQRCLCRIFGLTTTAM